MRQRYFSPQNLTHSQEYSFNADIKPDKRLRSNGSVSTMTSYQIANTFEENSDIIGDYKIDLKKQIGSGYSSKVYKGISLRNSQQVAVKILNIKKFSPSSLQMLDGEIKILQKMNHPNILKFFNVYKTHTQCYIVTELCSSGDLQTYMTRKGIFTEKQAIQIMSQISEGVKHLLKYGIIHRDLKPANILQGKTHWKIADFGFAIESEYEITTKHNVGTPLYMPPEALIKNLYSPQSDIFAVGIILYEMLMGVTPWQCSSEKQLIRRLTSIPLKIPSKAKLNLSTKHLLQKLCCVQISERTLKQQFLALNFNNFSSLDIMNLTYSKKSININAVSKKNIENRKSQTKSKSKRKILIKVTSKQALIKHSPSPNTSLLKSKETVKQKSKPKIMKSPSTKGKNQYLITNQLSSPSKNRKHSTESISLKHKKSATKKISTETNIVPYNLNETILSTSIYQTEAKKLQPNDHKDNRCKKVENKFEQKLFTVNHRIMINQLDYCRFMYYLIKNMHYFLVPEANRQKMGLIIFKHLIRLIKLLNDSKNNWFGFMNWEAFKKTQRYQNTIDTVAQYSKRYQRQYFNYLKNLQIGVVRDINQKLNELTNIQPFTVNIFSRLLNLISPIIKQSNQNISLLVQSQFTPLNKKMQSQVEALSAVIKYYKLIQISIKEFQNFSYFEENSEIFFLKDFSQSASNASMYFKLKDDIKFF